MSNNGTGKIKKNIFELFGIKNKTKNKYFLQFQIFLKKDQIKI